MHDDVAIVALPSRLTRLRCLGFDVLGRWSVVFIIGPVLALLLAEIAGTRWPVNLITPFVPQLTISVTVGIAGLFIARRLGRQRKRDRLWLGSGVVTALYAWGIFFGLVTWRVVPGAQPARATDANLGTIKILSSNVLTSNLDTQAELDLIAREDPDVILLMELNSRWINALREPLKAKYPIAHFVPDDSGNFGIGFWTRLPVADAQLFVMGPQENQGRYDVPQIDVTLLLADPNDLSKQRRVRFAGLHPLPPMKPNMSHARDSVLSRTATLLSKNAGVPTIIAGDLNGTRYCRLVKTLSDRVGLFDTMSGTHYSWPIRRGPLKWVFAIQIDQIMATGQFRVVESHREPRIGSDHYPIVSTLQLVE